MKTVNVTIVLIFQTQGPWARLGPPHNPIRQKYFNFLLILARFTTCCTTVPSMHCNIARSDCITPTTIYWTAVTPQFYTILRNSTPVISPKCISATV